MKIIKKKTYLRLVLQTHTHVIKNLVSSIEIKHGNHYVDIDERSMSARKSCPVHARHINILNIFLSNLSIHKAPYQACISSAMYIYLLLYRPNFRAYSHNEHSEYTRLDYALIELQNGNNLFIIIFRCRMICGNADCRVVASSKV